MLNTMVFSNEYSSNKSHDKALLVHVICHIAVTVAEHVPLCCSMRGCVVAGEVVAVCAAPCIWFGRFTAFLLLFQMRSPKELLLPL